MVISAPLPPPLSLWVDERETSRTEKRAPVAAPMTLSLVSRRVPHLAPLSFRCFPHGQRGHVPVVMETRANRDGNSAGTLSSLSLSLRSISFANSPFVASRPPSPGPLSLSLFLPPTAVYVPTWLRPALSPSFPNYLSPHRAPSYQADSPGGLSILRSPAPRNPPRRPRALAFQSPGLVSLTHARRIVMGNVQMH